MKNLMPTDVSIITTYRCQMECKMCDIWRNPTKKSEEIKRLSEKFGLIRYDDAQDQKQQLIKEYGLKNG